jgi:cysteine synthase
MSASAFAQTLPSSCSVNVVTGTGARFYVPSTTVPVNVLIWGNGTGGGATTYSSLLNAAASRCVLVAAATTANAGSGVAMRDAFNQARSRFATRLRSPLRACTSGHSQGGGGSFNAANVIGSAVDCVIAVQPDTVFTVTIGRPVAANVDVTCIFSTGDTLAPASRNAGNCRRNATIYRQVTTSGTHFSPTRTRGGAPGTAQRAQIDRLLR